MRRCETVHETWYCWISNGQPVVDEVKPDDFKSLEFADIATAPNKSVALVIYAANRRIKDWI